MRPKVTIPGLALFVVMIAGCNITTNPQGATPTVQSSVEASASATIPSPTPTSQLTTPTAAPSSTPEAPQPALATSTTTETPAPPSETPLPTGTPGPYVHTIAENDTLGYIIQLYGYDYDINVINEVVRLNDSITNADFLPPPGTQILIPRQTPTPIPAGAEITSTADAAIGATRLGDITVAGVSNFGCHIVEEDQTLVEIVLTYNTTLEIISQLNRDLTWAGCNFTEYSGGPRCNPIIIPGQCINVPLPTLTPTPSPTPNGSETPTAIPTYLQPKAVYPAHNQVVPAAPFRLQWVSAGILRAEENYLVEVTDTTTGAKWTQITRETSILLPETLIPSDGQPHLFQWYVAVARPNEQGVYGFISGSSEIHAFQWQSR